MLRDSSRRTGRCGCGCGAFTPLAKSDNRQKGHVKGQPVYFVKGHGRKITFGNRPPHDRTTPDVITAARSRAQAVNWEKARETRMANINARRNASTPAPVLTLCDAAALYRAEKERAIPRLRSRQALLLDEAKQAYERLQAIDAQRAKGGRPRKQSA